MVNIRMKHDIRVYSVTRDVKNDFVSTSSPRGWPAVKRVNLALPEMPGHSVKEKKDV